MVPPGRSYEMTSRLSVRLVIATLAALFVELSCPIPASSHNPVAPGEELLFGIFRYLPMIVLMSIVGIAKSHFARVWMKTKLSIWGLFITATIEAALLYQCFGTYSAWYDVRHESWAQSNMTEFQLLVLLWLVFDTCSHYLLIRWSSERSISIFHYISSITVMSAMTATAALILALLCWDFLREWIRHLG
jgi:hypothetical protein